MVKITWIMQDKNAQQYTQNTLVAFKNDLESQKPIICKSSLPRIPPGIQVIVTKQTSTSVISSPNWLNNTSNTYNPWIDKANKTDVHLIKNFFSICWKRLPLKLQY